MSRRKGDTKAVNPKDGIGITKTPLHLVSPIATVYSSVAKFLGNVKYGAWNYRGSQIRASVYYAALLRHMLLWWSGEEDDPIDGTPHLANAMACLEIIIEGRYIGNLIDDRPPRVDVRPAMNMVENLMPIIKAKYADKNPKHWTIADPTSIPVSRAKQRRKSVRA